MPKGKRKGKFEHRRTEQAYSSDEDAGIDMTIDNCSETSMQSDLKSNHEEPVLSEPRTRRRARSRRDLKEIEPEPLQIDSPYIVIYQQHVPLKPLPVKCKETWAVIAQNYWQPFAQKTRISGVKRGLFGNVLSEPRTRRRARSRRELKEIKPEPLQIDSSFIYQQNEPLKPLPVKCKETWAVIAQNYWEPFEQKTRISGVKRGLFGNENDIQEKLEEKVLELIEALSARSNAARAGAFAALHGVLQRRPLWGAVAAHRATLADHVSRALRRARDPERKAAAALTPLLALQIGEEGTEEFVKELRPALAAAAVDKTSSVETRTECCSSLAVLCYLLEEDVTEILEIMRIFETIFSGSYLKGDGSVKVSGSAVEEGAVHAAALDGWALLFSVLSPPHAASHLHTHPPSFSKLAELLEACSLEVRLSAGGALAAAHERAVEAGEAPDVSRVLPVLDLLVRDSNKFRAKRDRKLQRATFRDILKYFESEETPSLSVRVGAETVQCASWSACGAYGALAGALAGGLRALAPAAPPLRAALGLPPAPDPAAPPARRPNKLQRHLQNNAADKARTVARGKNRDKRSAALAI